MIAKGKLNMFLFMAITIFGALILFYEPLKFVYVYERGHGLYKKVVSVKHSYGKGRYDFLGHPLIEFTTADGMKHEFRSYLTYDEFLPYQAGDVVPIVFDPAYPVTAEVDRIMAIWYRPALLFILVEFFALAVSFKKE
ncbi:MAG: DUF3592 domain-containing protein [Candidatus Wallbacteria bacterium]